MINRHLDGVDLASLELFRKELHKNPEVSGEEKETALRVTAFLEQYNPTSILLNVGTFGIVATWDSGVSGPEILFRAELDALPIQEINTFPHQSKISGVSHKCGHDGHATILCGLAQYLSSTKITSGKVHLLFQPAEENGEGAKAMLADVRFNSINPDFVFALHNLPGVPKHAIVVKEQTFTAAVTSIIIHLKGKTSHAAEPEFGINPALAIAEILQESAKRADNNAQNTEMKVITPVCLTMGELSYGISAGEGSVHLTLRCWDDQQIAALKTEIENLSREIANRHLLEIEFDYTQTFHANQNDKKAVDILRKAIEAQGLDKIERSYPFKWGEDFGLFTAKFCGCMFGLGSGEDCPALHNPDYDFPDAITETGIRAFVGIINQFNQKTHV